MQLTLRIQSDHLAVTVSNLSSSKVRLWDLENSWGWDSFSFELRSESAERLFAIKRKVREWTKNGPAYFVLSSGESRDLLFSIEDGWWEIEDLLAWKKKTILVRARLNVNWSAEAEHNGVFVGEVLSEWVVSAPPHKWLFPWN
jgi:hypothetical protein